MELANEVTKWFNIVAEKRLIHEIFCGRQRNLIDDIEPLDFYDSANQEIIKVGKAIRANGKIPDMVTLSQQMNGETCAIVSNYRHAADDEPYGYDPGNCIDVLKELRKRREAYATLQATMNDLQSGETGTDEILAKAFQRVSRLGTFDVQQDSSLQGVLERTYDTIAARAEGKITTVSTGIPALDELTGGLFPGEMTVLGARPGTGKTALTLQIAEHAAMAGQRVVFVSREMSDVQIGERILARYGINMARSRIGRLRADDWEVAQEALKTEQYRNILVDNRSTTITKVRTMCRKWAAQGGLDLVCIDYLQLIHPEGSRGSRNDQVAEISWAVKEMAVDLKVPVLLLSQLNRDTKNRTDPTPQLTDLRDSGAVEQDADNVWLLYCPEKVADPDVQVFIDMERDPGRAVVAVYIAKARQSVVGTIYTQFIKDKMKFVDTRPQPLPEQMSMGQEI